MEILDDVAFEALEWVSCGDGVVTEEMREGVNEYFGKDVMDDGAVEGEDSDEEGALEGSEP